MAKRKGGEDESDLRADLIGINRYNGSPERSLIAAIVMKAVSDCCAADYSERGKRGDESPSYAMNIRMDAFDYLMTNRCAEHMSWIDLDPESFRKSLISVMFSSKANRDISDKNKRVFRAGYTMYQRMKEAGMLDQFKALG